jgi:hypothetical protein
MGHDSLWTVFAVREPKTQQPLHLENIMAAPNAIPSPGAADGGADRAALFLKLFAGETLKLLERRLIVEATTSVKRALAGGKTASFPTFGAAHANYHVPGEDLLIDQDAQTVAEDYVSDIAVGEHLIHADRVLQSSVVLDELEGILSHWDHRSAFSSKLVTAMAEQSEDGLFRLIAGASGLSGAVPDGTVITEWSTGTAENNGAAAITALDGYDKLYVAAETLDTESVAKERRFGATTTALFYGLLRLTGNASNVAYEVVNKDYIGGQNGDLARPNDMGIWIGNIFVMASNGIPTSANGKYTNDAWSLNATEQNPYDTADMSKTVKLLVWGDEAIGTVRARESRMDVNYIPERLAHLITVSRAVGHGILRPEAAYTFRVTA